MKSQTVLVPSQMSLTQLCRKSLLALSSRHVYRENIIEMWILHRSDALQLNMEGGIGGTRSGSSIPPKYHRVEGSRRDERLASITPMFICIHHWLGPGEQREMYYIGT